MSKSVVSKIKPAGSAGIMTKKTSTVDDKTEKKPSGKPASGSKVEEKLVKKKPLVEEKKSAASGQVDIKRTMNLLVEKVKVDSNKEDKSSAQRRVGIYIFCD